MSNTENTMKLIDALMDPRFNKAEDKLGALKEAVLYFDNRLNSLEGETEADIALAKVVLGEFIKLIEKKQNVLFS